MAVVLIGLAGLLVPEFWNGRELSEGLWLSPGAHAQEEPAAPPNVQAAAYLVQVPLPIEGNVDAQVKGRVQLILKSLENAPAASADKRPVLVLEFRASSGSAGETSSFGRSLELAQFLTSDELNRVRTVAYLPQSVKGHAVLPVLACESIVMAKDAEFGEAGYLAQTVTEAAITNYVDIASRRHTIPDAIARGLIDQKTAVYQVTTPDGVRFETASGRDALQKEGKSFRETTVFEPGEPHKLIGVQMRDFGFAIHKAESRRELTAALELPANSLQGTLAPEQGWEPILVSLDGPVTQRTVTWIIKSMEGHVQRDDFNLLIMHVNSTGGDPEQSLRLARALADLDDRFHSVAVVDQRALGDAALIAWGADELLVHERADLGGAGEAVLDDNLLTVIRDPLRELAQRRDRDWSLPLALVDPRVEVYPYVRGDGEKRFLTSEEVQEFRDPDRWQRAGEPLPTSRGIDGAAAVEIGFAQGTIHNLEELKSRYGIQKLSPLRPNWALELVEWLADPRLAALLLFVGWFALMIELSSPGVGVPGFVSAVCFILYFWSQFLHGTADWLEIVLFLTGALFVAVEIFVLPGFGVFGIGGGLMVIISIILASQTFVIPGNEYQMRQFPVSLMLVAAGASGAIASVYVIRRFLPHTPYFNRMLLAPPEGEELEELNRRESLVFYDHLAGKYGVATTPLVPSGKARFGDELVDVISDGEMIPKGTPVYVAEVLGNRVVVKAVVA